MIRFPVVRTLTLVAAVGALASVLGAAVPSAAYAASSPTPLTMSVDAPTSLPYRDSGTLTVTVSPAVATAAGELVVTTRKDGGTDSVFFDQPVVPSDGPVAIPIIADAARTYTATFTPSDTDTWSAPPPQSTHVAISAVATTSTITVVGSAAQGAAVTAGTQLWRSFGGVATMTLLDSDRVPVPGEHLTLQQVYRGAVGTLVTTVATVVTGPDGKASVAINPWGDVTYRVTYAGAAGRLGGSTSRPLLVHPLTPGARVLPPAGSPQPVSVAAPLGRGTGAGANAVVSAIPDAVWSSMVGYSWIPGCPLGRSQLSYILVNYWGFDGNRYRGELVVAKSRAAAFARAFTAIYNAHFPIRSMVRPDRWGRSPNGWLGANDYASMAHDNTYGFNCRFVVGNEARHQLSPHAYGIAVDINTWENPDAAANGIHPNAWFYHHRSASYGGILLKNGIVIAIMRGQGFGWGGTSIGDTQHFDPTLL